MIKSAKLFYHFFKESLKEFNENFKIYLVYIVGLCLVSVIQISFDSTFSSDDVVLRFISKSLFSFVPLLILSKILYVIKIRTFGSGEFLSVVWRFLLYNFYYFVFILASLGLYISGVAFAGVYFDLKTSFAIASFLLFPFIYLLVFYSLSPYVAVFNEDGPVFAKSKDLSVKNIYLVIESHLFSLAMQLVFSTILLIKDKNLKIAMGMGLSVPEAIFSIVMVLTTTKIYMHLSERE